METRPRPIRASLVDVLSMLPPQTDKPFGDQQLGSYRFTQGKYRLLHR